ncbi:MAG: hypothetical protein CR982_04880 [Candidatus Cloacimonadota bacterium]|nr:MAG: hypothetical protein CR982_04880 [Candidatus Cloacimonadota bacterium]PIE79848.1 MAG: hypothetical protein CSA15_02555 [Candidatus Delongbacteria bacterium]
MNFQLDLEIFTIVFLSLFLLGSLNKVILLFSKSNESFLKSVSFSLTFVLFGIAVLIVTYYYDSIAINEEIRTVALLFVFIPLIKIVDRSIAVKKLNLRVKTPKIIHDIILLVIYIFVFFTILKAQLGIDLTPIVTTSAVVSMVIGLALQDTLTNFIAGLMIHVEKPFNITDWVSINNTEGKVIEINWRTTKVLTFNNDFLIIPNNSIIKNEMVNYNFPSTRHVLPLNIGASYDAPPSKVKSVILDILKSCDDVLRFPNPIIRLTSYDDFSINYEIRVWIDDYGKKKLIEDSVLSKIWYAFNREGIKIPFPIRDVYHHTPNKESNDNNSDALKLKLLSDVDIFSSLSVEDLKSLSSKSKFVEYGVEEYIFMQGDEGSSLFIVSKGSVEVIINNNPVATLSKGNFFGEMSLLTGENRSGSVRVVDDVQIMEITKEDLSFYLNKEPNLVSSISEILAARERDNILSLSKNSNKSLSNSKSIDYEKKSTLLKSIKSFFNIG